MGRIGVAEISNWVYKSNEAKVDDGTWQDYSTHMNETKVKEFKQWLVGHTKQTFSEMRVAQGEVEERLLTLTTNEDTIKKCITLEFEENLDENLFICTLRTPMQNGVIDRLFLQLSFGEDRVKYLVQSRSLNSFVEAYFGQNYSGVLEEGYFRTPEIQLTPFFTWLLDQWGKDNGILV